MQHGIFPKISVVIPVLNSVNTLEKAIMSVINQQYQNCELIILDAGSTDGTVSIIQRYQSFIYYWHSKPDGSPAVAINIGIQQATGELIAQLMADDWFEPGTFHAIGQAYRENPTADIISCGGRIVHYDDKRATYVTKQIYHTPEQLKIDVYRMCFKLVGMSSRFIAKSFLDKIGLMIPFDSQGKHNFSVDRELLLRAAVLGCHHVIINHLGHSYFAHSASATFGKNRANQLKIYQEHMHMVDRYLAVYTLCSAEKSILLRWYDDQSVRLFLFKMCKLEIKDAWNIAKNGIKRSKMHWLIALFSTPCKIASQKIYARLMEK